MENLPPRKSSGDGGLADFKRSISDWKIQAELDCARLEEAGNGKAQWRRSPLWNCIGIAKRSGERADWDMAMGMLAQAALDNRRPIMVAATALSSIRRDGHDVPFESLALLVEPILHERDMGAPGYDWANNFPLERSELAWTAALEARKLSKPTGPASAPPPASPAGL
jgi:hypothetical protein